MHTCRSHSHTTTEHYSHSRGGNSSHVMLRPHGQSFSLCELSGFPPRWVKREACQKSDSPNPSQTAGDGMNQLLELSLSSPAEYKEAEAYHWHSLREEKLNPSLEIWIAQIWAASKSVLCYYRDGYYGALPHNVRLIFLDISLKNKCH